MGHVKTLIPSAKIMLVVMLVNVYLGTKEIITYAMVSFTIMDSDLFGLLSYIKIYKCRQ